MLYVFRKNVFTLFLKKQEMTSRVDNLIYLLKTLYSGGLSFSELHSIIKISTRLAEIITRSRYSNIFPRTVFHGITIQEIITDSITPLFTSALGSNDIPLRKALLNWDENIQNEESAYFFLSQIISNRIEQEISKKLKEADLSSVIFDCR